MYLRYSSRYSNAIFCSTLVKVMLLCPVSHIFKMVGSKTYFCKFFNSWKCSRCLKYAVLSCFKQNYRGSGLPQVIPMQFFLSSGESHVVVTSLTHIYSGLQQNLIFQIFSSWKMLKMLKISCFKQNQCISDIPQGIPMQFFAQHW